MQQQFGGAWTVQKLECVREYLQSFVRVMKNQQFSTYYIDAFAGTGYVDLRPTTANQADMLPLFEEAESESRHLLQGSAEQALGVDPAFDHFIFIERSDWRVRELNVMRARNLDKWGSIEVVHGDANDAIRQLCAQWNKRNDRGVIFLDPFGMTVDWATLEAIAGTQSLDLWYLFPIGAVNRLLVRDGGIPEAWVTRLNSLFGTRNWQTEFFSRRQERTLWGEPTERVKKVCDWIDIQTFWLAQLGGLFPAVADNPLVLRNSTGSPLFLLCFAVSNPSPKAISAAMKIANHILRNH